MQKNEWVGLRERDNFSYTKGKIPVYDSNCNNGIIISNLEKGIIEGRSNHALIENHWKSYIIPITEIDEIINISKEMFGKERVFYEKPKSIFEMQSLKTLREEEIKQQIFENYDLEVKNLFEVRTKKGDNRVYKIVSKENKKFMLKYQGKDSELFEFHISFKNFNSVFLFINFSILPSQV